MKLNLKLNVKRKLRMIMMPLLLTSLVAGCQSKAKDPTEVVVFAAASMTETLTKLSQEYELSHGGVKLTFNFDSSGTLKTQIEEGAQCDVFISAGQQQMNELDLSADPALNPKRLNFVVAGTRRNLLENKVALAVPKDNPKGILNFVDLAQKLKTESVLMAMGNQDVPVGQYTQKILAYFNLNEAELAKAGKLTYGSNVKEVTTQLAEGTVDCGVIYSTDAKSANLTVVDYATSEMSGQVIYPAAVMKSTRDQTAAAEFLDYLKSARALEVFSEVGFSGAE